MDATDAGLAASLEQGRYIIAGLLLALLWAIESVTPMFAGRRRRLSHAAANLGIAALNGVVGVGLAFAIAGVTSWAEARNFGLLNIVTLPAWAEWLAAILLFDCWQYWWHRANHRLSLLWRFHAIHHADAEMDVTTGVRFHTVEIGLSFLARLAVLPLLGLTLPQLLLYEALSLPVILFHHGNLAMPRRLDAGLRWLIVTPWMHVVHHSRWRPEMDSNYASLLSVWDRLFGSFRLRPQPTGIALGLEGFTEREWRGLPGMLITPLTRPGFRP
jgi:sterol desaturase/sphingolipid hydroxylase (fatty acid hydroxylase superfamily)